MDGSHGEGGGQLFRTALAMSALTGEAARIVNIRAGRPKPGLSSQHITAARAVASLCDGETEGLAPSSREVVFRPGILKGGSASLDVGTAGSVTLVLQACLLAAAFAKAPTELRIKGGTDVKWSPPADYFARVFLPHLARMGVHSELRVERRGYYPRGGGLVEVRVEPAASLRPLSLLTPGKVRQIGGRAHVSNLPAHIAHRMKTAALKSLMSLEEAKIEEVVYDQSQAVGPGGAIVLWGETENALLGSSGLAEKGVRAEDIGQKAAEALMADLKAGATMDVHAADQLLPYMALAQGSSSFLVREVTAHASTLIWLLTKFTGVDFRLGPLNGLTRIEVHPTRTSRAL